jgi:hypothetical protein
MEKEKEKQPHVLRKLLNLFPKKNVLGVGYEWKQRNLKMYDEVDWTTLCLK